MDEQEVVNQIKELQKQRTSLKEQDITLVHKITSEQFKNAYLATMKDIQNPDFEDPEESNWNRAYKSIINSVNS